MTDLALSIHNKGLLQAMTQGPDILAKHLDLSILRTVQEWARTARGHAPKAFSTLTNAINHRHPAPMVGEVVAGTDYARMVEEGTGPGGWPSLDSLIAWIGVKNIVPNDPTMDERDLAFAIARKIVHQGTPAQPYMKPTLTEGKPKAERRVSKAIDAALREMGSR